MDSIKEMGYTVKDACKVIGISRSWYYAVKKRKDKREVSVSRDEALLDEIKRIKGEHPYWGYRRVWAQLFYRGEKKVNRKRVYRIMKENGLLVLQVVHKAKRVERRNKPRADRPLQYWGIDMTKFMIQGVGWAYLYIAPLNNWTRRK